MPLTNAEHQKWYHKKLKEKYSSEDLRMGESDHHKRKQTENLEEVRSKDRERQRKYRAQKKAGKNSNSPAYKCKGTLTKAVKKAASVSLNSPRKRSEVVKELMY